MENRNFRKKSLVLFVLIFAAFMILAVRPERAAAVVGTYDSASKLYYLGEDGGKRLVIMGGKSQSTITIPRTITVNGTAVPVARICAGAFAGMKGLKTVVIQAELYDISKGVFEDCTDLEKVTLPATIEIIRENAFAGCTKLSSLGDNMNKIRTIRQEAFKGCTSLKIFTSNNMRTLQDSAFEGCTSLTKLSLTGYYTSIPERMCYGCTSLTDLTLKKYISNLGSYAFARSGISSFTVSGGISAIGEGAFSQCTRLQSVVVENGVEEIGTKCFQYNTSLTTVSLPVSLTKIGADAFAYCGKLEDPGFSSELELTTIGVGAYRSCTSLSEVVLPISVKTVGQEAFAGCTGLQRFFFSPSMTEIPVRMMDGCSTLSRVTIPSNIIRIRDCAFANMPKLIYVSLLRDTWAYTDSKDADIFAGGDRLRLCLYGNEGSTAQEYAQKFGWKWWKLEDNLADRIWAQLSPGAAPGTSQYDYFHSGDNYVLPPCNYIYKGHYFTGWNVRIGLDGTVELKQPGAVIPQVTKDIYCTAQWGNCLVVTMKGGSYGFGDPVTAYVRPGNGIIVPKNSFYATNYIFKGWFGSDGNYYEPGDWIPSLTGDLTLTADWTVTYPINYNAMDGTFSNGTNLATGRTGVGGVMVDPPVPTREGWRFGGWLASHMSTVKIVDEDDSLFEFLVENPAPRHINLQAVWVPAEPRRILLDGNGGTIGGEEVVELLTDKNGDIQVSMILNVVPDPREGYTFKRWKAPGGRMLFPGAIERFNEDSRIYAIWEENPKEENPKEDTPKPAEKPAETSAAKTLEQAEKEIGKLTGSKAEKDPAGSDYIRLRAKMTKVTSSSVKISWSKVKKAKEYAVYAALCGKTSYQKVKTVAGKSYTLKKWNKKKLKKGTYYKFIVAAVDADGRVLALSKTIHAATSGGKVTNAKSITTKAKKDKVKLKVKKTFKLKAKAVAAKKNLKMKTHTPIRYESSDPKVATVSKKGVIKGVRKGTCQIYVFAQDGVSRKIKVTVQ